MIRYFFDTSALAKRYHTEAGTPRVARIFSGVDREVRISQLSFVEFHSVFAGKVRAGVIERRDAGLQRARLLLDIAAGEIVAVGLTSDHFRGADELFGRYGFSHRLRTLDALQLAVGLDLRNQDILDHFVAADKVLLDVARLEGLSVMNPEDPELDQ
ncbi:MAG: type II toxin-antitoxin system VapC family toxin [Acidobacteriia bacterium]|nr:type II toxin-antitoxin system VapC family toxin [Terriglobia bacterium]